MESSVPPFSRRAGFGRLLLYSFALYSCGGLVEEMVRWTNPLHGLVNGMFHLIPYGILWFLTLLPWSIFIVGLYKWRKWVRFKSYWIIVPSIALSFLRLTSLITWPPTSEVRFHSFAGAKIPENASDIHSHLSGGGLADYIDTYYFKCPPAELEKLLVEMRLTPGDSSRALHPIEPLRGCPDINSWPSVRVYRRNDEKWLFYLITPESKTEAYVRISCI